MKKNKTIAYMLAATLLVGGTFVGTKAWFSDQVTTDNGIKITMGTLDLELEETHTGKGENLVKGWQLVREGEAESNNVSFNGMVNKEFLNIRPGDKFERTITITNKGTLDQNVTVTKTTEGQLSNLFELSVVNGSGELNTNNSSFKLNSGDSKTVKLRLTPNAENLVNNDYNHANHDNNLDQVQDGHEFDLKKVLGNIEIKGEQINYEESTTQN